MSNINFNVTKANPTGYVVGAQFNQLVDLVRSIAINDHPDYNISRNLSGTKLNINFPSVPTPTSQTSYQQLYASHPYQGYDASSGSNFIVSIQYGTHNSVPPSMSLGAGNALGVRRQFNTMSLDAGAQIVYVGTRFNSGSFASCSIGYSDITTPPTSSIDGGGNGSFYQTIFAVSCSLLSGSIAQVTCADNVLGSQRCYLCSNTASVWQSG
jgi:hypothetical protein